MPPEIYISPIRWITSAARSNRPTIFSVRTSPAGLEKKLEAQLHALPFYLWREAGQFCTRVSADEEDWAGSTSRNF